MRLFDTDLFDQEWFGVLTPRLKLLYIYALMKCDCAGIIELNFRKFTFDINCADKPISREELFGSFGGRIIPLGGSKDECTKAIIPDFIRFHYGKRLVNDRRHNIHRSVVKRIKSVGLTLERVCELATKKFEFDNFDDITPNTEIEVRQTTMFPVEQSDVQEADAKKTRRTKSPFQPPTLDEVREYFASKGTTIDPEEFWSKYQSVGWVDKNGNRIKDWRRCLVTWERFRKGTSMSPSVVKHGDNWRAGNIAEASSVL